MRHPLTHCDCVGYSEDASTHFKMSCRSPSPVGRLPKGPPQKSSPQSPFRDEFEEFKAKAAGTPPSWLGHRRRQEFIAAHGTVVNNSSNNPPSRMDQRMSGRQRQRSRSLAPPQAGAIRLLMPSTSPLKEDQHSSGTNIYGHWFNFTLDSMGNMGHGHSLLKS